MGRGRVQLKRIDNKINRQVTFSKRRTGIIKKAHEISVLCEADVALIVFSTKGRLFEYSTDQRMEGILERYERYSKAETQVQVPGTESTAHLASEYVKLKARLEVLRRNESQLKGEDLDTTSLRELQPLEQQLDSALKNIRRRKNYLMNESISVLRKKEKALEKQNNLLNNKGHRRDSAESNESEFNEDETELRRVRRTPLSLKKTILDSAESDELHTEFEELD